MNLDDFRNNASAAESKNKKLFAKLKRTKPKDLDQQVHQFHDEAFEHIDCLKCANCCKTTSPIFYQRDMDRAAKHLRMKTGDFLQKYLHMDEDGDFVLNEAPCPFLGSDNYCSIYESRPDACREYPHTNRKKVVQIMDLTYRNTLVCPAVFEIAEKLRKIY
ncbi:MAG: YkgJ family cysteine cluster protein [Bacteroidia bacterium]|nr:YkgJ family cysteine cluster protein [Bacteroidia bacterium]